MSREKKKVYVHALRREYCCRVALGNRRSAQQAQHSNKDNATPVFTKKENATLAQRIEILVL